MPALNKLNVTDSLKTNEGKKYSLRLRDDLAQWIEDNTTGSQVSVINFLVNIGINQIENILTHDSLYETVSLEEDEE